MKIKIFSLSSQLSYLETTFKNSGYGLGFEAVFTPWKEAQHCNISSYSMGGHGPLLIKSCSQRLRYSNRTVTYSIRTVIKSNITVKPFYFSLLIVNDWSSVSLVMSIAANFDSCGMGRAGGYDFFSFFFALQLNFSLRFDLKLAPSLIGLLHPPMPWIDC